MYKILIKFDNKVKNNLWEVYGSSTTSITGTTTSTDFETDDIEALEAELLKIDQIFGHENIMVIKQIDVNYTVDVTDKDVAPSVPNPDIPSTDEGDTGI